MRHRKAKLKSQMKVKKEERTENPNLVPPSSSHRERETNPENRCYEGPSHRPEELLAFHEPSSLPSEKKLPRRNVERRLIVLLYTTYRSSAPVFTKAKGMNKITKWYLAMSQHQNGADLRTTTNQPLTFFLRQPKSRLPSVSRRSLIVKITPDPGSGYQIRTMFKNS